MDDKTEPTPEEQNTEAHSAPVQQDEQREPVTQPSQSLKEKLGTKKAKIILAATVIVLAAGAAVLWFVLNSNDDPSQDAGNRPADSAEQIEINSDEELQRSISEIKKLTDDDEEKLKELDGFKNE